MMSLSPSGSNWSADAWVTAANPAPGQTIVDGYPVRSGTGWTEAYVTRSDGGIGLNVYVAGGTGPNGVLPVSQTNPASVSGSFSIPVEAYPNALENTQFTRQKQLYDLDGTGTNYVGYAVLGTSPASASWTIKRLTFNVSGNLSASEWSSVTATWDNRTSEVYS